MAKLPYGEFQRMTDEEKSAHYKRKRKEAMDRKIMAAAQKLVDGGRVRKTKKYEELERDLIARDIEIDQLKFDKASALREVERLRKKIDQILAPRQAVEKKNGAALVNWSR